MTLPVQARYTWGGDESLFIEIDEEMSLEANFISNSMSAALEAEDLPGVLDISPANASLLIRFNPDVLNYKTLEDTVHRIESDVRKSTSQELETRIIEVPVWYGDPYTGETMSRFREGYHQMPEGNDLDYGAEVNGLSDAAEFIKRHHETAWIASMVGFVSGLPFLYQLTPRDKQLVVPKYLSPRTDTPALTIGHGGCFACIYSVRGAGGYQMFGITPSPIYDPKQELADFQDFMVLFSPGDIVKFRPVEEAEYREIEEQVKNGTWKYRQAPFNFVLSEALADPTAYNEKILEALNGA